MLASLGDMVAVEKTLAEALASATESVTVFFNANVVIDFMKTVTAETLTIVENKTMSMTFAAETLADTEAVSVTREAVIKIVAVETVAMNLRAKAAAVATAEATAKTALAEAVAETVAAVAEVDSVAVAVTVEAVAVAANDSLLCDTDLLVLNTMAVESGVTADLVGTLLEGLLVAETLAAKAEAATVETVAVTVAVAVAVTVAVAVAVIEAETVMAVSDVMVLSSAGDSSERSDEVSANHFNERGDVKIFCCFFLASQCF